jgi:putative transposase
MPRIARVAPGGQVYHVINRANGRLRLMKTEKDFAAFEQAMVEAHQRHPLPLLGWCLMGNHWHFVVHPKEEGDLARFFGYLTLIHATRWQVAHKAIGIGHIYQGRFKSFMIERDEHLLWVLRYVERNPLRAKLVTRAQDWRWSSLHVRGNGPAELRSLLSDWPIERPRNWLSQVNRPQTPAEESAITNAIKRTCPLGNANWVNRMAIKHDLQSTLRPRGRQTGWRKSKQQIVE